MYKLTDKALSRKYWYLLSEESGDTLLDAETEEEAIQEALDDWGHWEEDARGALDFDENGEYLPYREVSKAEIRAEAERQVKKVLLCFDHDDILRDVNHDCGYPERFGLVEFIEDDI